MENDRSPRTPPALSNATPRPTELEKAIARWIHAKREQALREDSRGELLNEVRRQECDVEDALYDELEAKSHAAVSSWGFSENLVVLPDEPAAAPPVAEGPAATPRHDENTLRELLAMMWDKYEDGDSCYEDPNEHAGFIGHAVRLSFEEEEKVLNAIKEPPAAAEPFAPNAVEARAAAIFFEPLGYCVHSVTQADCGSCCRRILAALQRQLDEARRELAETQDTLHCARHLH